MEACVYYKLKDKKAAFAALHQAYKTAVPNEIITPFVEFGKDMRTLTAAALKDSNRKIPKSWLENINLKAASYAKHQARIITEYKLANNVPKTITLSAREKEILKDISHGLSRASIDSERSLSINTVKMVINNVYMKLGAENLPAAIRIATEKKLI
jgi:DNA-binding NarL/FixJ family response regulator